MTPANPTPAPTVDEEIARQAKAGTLTQAMAPAPTTKLDIAGMCDRYPEGRWIEDKDHENGNYNCRCLTCGKTFIGHKRRVECKVCATAPAPTPIDELRDHLAALDLNTGMLAELVEKAQAELAQAQANLKRKQKLIGIREEQLAAKDAEIAELKDKVVSAAWEYGKQKARAEKAEAELVRANQAIDHIDAAANSMLAKAESERDQLRAEVERLRKESDVHVKIINDADRELEQAGIETENIIRQVPPAEGIQQLRAQLAAAQEDARSYKAARDFELANLQEARRQHAAAQEDKARLMHIFHHDAPKPEPGDHFNEWLAAIDAARKA